LDDNADHEATRAKRQKLLHNEEAEFKYVTLADDAVESLSTDQTSSESELGFEIHHFTEYGIVPVRIPPRPSKGESTRSFSHLDAC
jgi:hypothetical protein